MAIKAEAIDRLKAQLLTSGLQQKNNPLFQVINQLIDAVRQGLQNTETILGGGGGGGGGGVAGQSFLTENDDTATLPNSRQTIAGAGIQFLDGKPGRRVIQTAIPFGSNEGESGEDGPPGPQGIQGIAGVAGIDGIAGPPGMDGLDGIDGQDGLPGPQGAAGATGASGSNAISFFYGYDGEDGEDGFPGIPGPAGSGSDVTLNYDSGLTTLPNSITVLTASETDVYFLILTNLTTQVQPVTITDGNDDQYLEDYQLAPNDFIAFELGGMTFANGIKWMADNASSVNAQIKGVQ